MYKVKQEHKEERVIKDVSSLANAFKEGLESDKSMLVDVLQELKRSK